MCDESTANITRVVLATAYGQAAGARTNGTEAAARARQTAHTELAGPDRAGVACLARPVWWPECGASWHAALA